jgi:hypothetical protein
MFNCIYCGAELKFLNNTGRIFEDYSCENHDNEVVFGFRKNELYDILISFDDNCILIDLNEKLYTIYRKRNDSESFDYVDQFEYTKLPTPENIELFLLFK